MTGPIRLLPALLIAATACAADKPAEVRDKVVGKQVPHFVLPDTAGKATGLFDFLKGDDFAVVVFLGTKCPVGNAYLPILEEVQKEFRDKKVRVVGINAIPGDTADAVKKHITEFKVTFPVLLDPKQSTLALFGAKRTPEVFVLDRRGVVRYHGRVDDRYAPDHKRDEPRRHDLKEALTELVAGKKVSVPETDAAGCLITVAGVKKGDVTYSKHVAAILQKQCADCHHPGTAAPFSLLTYADAKNQAAMIQEVVATKQMPPWHADPRFGHFSNERRLSQDEIDTLSAWVAAGAPEGDKKDAPAAKEYAEGWRIGKPDAVFKMPQEVTVQATGKVAYKYFKTKTEFTEDKWIQAAEVRPGNKAAVHHIIVFARAPGKVQEWIAAVAPGADPFALPAGFGRKIPAGAELIWQVHYTPTGKEEKDCSEIGLVFCKEPPKNEVKNYGIANSKFKIPAGAGKHEVVAEIPVFREGVVLAMFPHMHLRGKDVEYTAVYPDGKTETLLSVPQYDFNWQHTYRFAEPLKLPKGSKIRVVAHFDNSADNPANPDPTKDVKWGDQTWEEMMIGYVDFYWETPAK